MKKLLIVLFACSSLLSQDYKENVAGDGIDAGLTAIQSKANIGKLAKEFIEQCPNELSTLEFDELTCLSIYLYNLSVIQSTYYKKIKDLEKSKDVEKSADEFIMDLGDEKVLKEEFDYPLLIESSRELFSKIVSNAKLLKIVKEIDSFLDRYLSGNSEEVFVNRFEFLQEISRQIPLFHYSVLLINSMELIF